LIGFLSSSFPLYRFALSLVDFVKIIWQRLFMFFFFFTVELIVAFSLLSLLAGLPFLPPVKEDQKAVTPLFIYSLVHIFGRTFSSGPPRRVPHEVLLVTHTSFFSLSGRRLLKGPSF